jgi:pre-mRNA-splicing factor ATP-dependent RNA helicase DHX15/PRP43
MQFANHIRQAILSGYFANIAMALPAKSDFITLKDNAKAILFPTCCLQRKPQFVIYNEFVLTSNNYLRTVTSISDEWLLEACPAYFEDLDDFDGLQLQAIKTLKKRVSQKQKAKRARDEDSD